MKIVSSKPMTGGQAVVGNEEDEVDLGRDGDTRDGR